MNLENREKMSDQDRERIDKSLDALIDLLKHSIARFQSSSNQAQRKAIKAEIMVLKSAIDEFKNLIEQYNRLEHSVEQHLKARSRDTDRIRKEAIDILNGYGRV